MAVIQELLDSLEQIKQIHSKKNSDYAGNNNPFENFERSACIAEWFEDPVDKSFVVLIGTKLARLATLLNSKNAPNNESIDDSFLDLSTYCLLWKAYHQVNSNVHSNSDLENLLSQTHEVAKELEQVLQQPL